MRLRGSAALDGAIDAPEPSAGVVADEVVAERGAERRGEDLHGAVGRVEGGAITHQGGPPGPDLGACDLRDAQAPEVRDDQLVDPVGPLVPGDGLPCDPLGAEPVLEPIREHEAPLRRRPLPALQVADEDPRLALGGEASGAPLAALDPVDPPRLPRPLGLVDQGGHAAIVT